MLKERTIISKILTIVPEIKEGVKVSLFVAIIYEVFRLTPLFIVKFLVDMLVAGEGTLPKIIGFILGVFATYVILTGIDFVVRKKQFLWTFDYEILILKRAKQKLLDLQMKYHETYNTGTLVSKITKGAHKLSELSWFLFNEFIPTGVQLILTFFLLLYEQWILALAFAILMPLTTWFTHLASNKSQKYRKAYHRQLDHAVGELGESVFNIKTVKDFAQEKRQYQTFSRMLTEYKQLAEKRWNFSQIWWLKRDTLIIFGRAGTLGIAVWMVMKGMISTGSLVLIYSLTERAFLSAFRLGHLHSHLEDAMESLNRLYDLMKEKVTIKSGKKTLQQLKGDVEFKNISFGYGSQKVLKNFSLSIPARNVIAFVGRSGAGKSTIVKLLLRNYDVNSGEIQVDGVDVKEFDSEMYKRRIAVVSQDVEVFNRSVMDNILFANPDASKAHVIAAAKKAHAHEFIMEFPKGYETIIGEKGVRLSGGQKQRLSIARALLANPDIYIFDEATSSLDSESERYIQESIFSIAGKKTTIIIAHRLSTIRHADQIVVMEKGKIVEKGTYQTLLRKRGAFHKMVKLQDVDALRK